MSAQQLDTVFAHTDNYRHVRYTRSGASQLVSMKLAPGEEIGWEMHEDTDQHLVIVGGTAGIWLGGKEKQIAESGDAVVVPMGTRHNVTNESKTKPLRLWSVYAPPEHPPTRKEKEKKSNDEENNDRKLGGAGGAARDVDAAYMKTLQVSSRKNKKYQITVGNKTIHFGDSRYQQYRDQTPMRAFAHMDHNDMERKRRYYLRHGVTTERTSAKYWSNKLLW